MTTGSVGRILLVTEATRTHGAVMQDKTAKGLTLLTVCLSLFLIQLDLMVANLALPSIQRDIGGGLAGQQWIMDAYTLVYAALLASGGALGDRIGQKRVLIIGLVVFAAGSLVCGLAGTIGVLIAGRALQGVGAAIEIPTTLAIIATTFPEEKERARAMAAWATVNGVALAVGPSAGAFMVEHLGWPSVFLLNLPVAALTLPLALIAIREHGRGSGRRVGAPTQIAFALFLAATTAVGIEGARLGWGSAAIVGGAAIALASLGAFLRIDRRAEHPLIPGALLRGPGAIVALAVTAMMTFAMYGLLFMASLYFQSVRGVSPFIAGLGMLPISVAYIVTAQATGRLAHIIATRWLITAGMAAMGLGMMGFGTFTSATSWSYLIAVFVVTGIGLGFNTAPAVGLAVKSAPKALAGTASGLVNTARMAGATLGVAALGALLGAGAPARREVALLSGMHHASWLGAAVLMAGAALAAIALRSRTGPANFDGPFEPIRRWRRRAAHVAELQRLDDQTLADMGLHRSGIRAAVIAAERGGFDHRHCR
jgi:EmrB/QacA subfamily drug resistance transporter